jgi:alkaline phosphatase D
MPLGRQVEDDRDGDGRMRFEGVANGDGPALGRELEVARLLRAMKRAGVGNVVWLTGDVHYTAAHYFDPEKARFTDFDPFWEFVSGPIHAGGGIADASRTDDTFGQQVVFQRSGGPSPYDEKLYYGAVTIDAKTRTLAVALKDLNGVTHFSRTLEPQRA